MPLANMAKTFITKFSSSAAGAHITAADISHLSFGHLPPYQCKGNLFNLSYC